MLPLKIITLAAGAGLRLKDYPTDKSLPKPLVNILGKSMIEWSLKSYHPFITKGLISKSDLYFVILDEHDKNYFISKQLKVIFGDQVNIIRLNKLSSGPAETAYLAAKQINQNCSIIFNDCDHYFDSNALYNKILEIKKTENIYGIINVADTNSTKPEWSYVEQNNHGKIISIKEKDINLAKKGAKGVVASYFFSNINFFLNECRLMITENDKVGDKNKREFYISKVYDRLIKKNKNFLLANTKFAHPLGTPDQISTFIDQYSDSVFYPESKTFIFDIDGVLFHHDKGFHSEKSSYTYPIKPIPENIDLLKKEYEKGSCIIIMSARVESERDNINKQLNNLEVKFHQLILGVSGGTRILINDNKPNNENLKTAIAIQSNRNHPINVKDIDDLTNNPIKKFSGGSYAQTYLMPGKRKFVRKLVSNNIEYERGEAVLKGQYLWLKLAQKNKLPVPKLYNFDKNYDFSYLDYQYIKDHSLLSEYIDNKEKFKPIFLKVLASIDKFHDLNSINSSKDLSLLSHLINFKAKPSLDFLKENKLINSTLKQKKISINGNKIDNINFCFNKILDKKDKFFNKASNIFDSENKTVIHGDLTLENIIVSKNKFYFIDPLGAVMDYKSKSDFFYKTNIFFDLGKLCQSLLSKYETWKNFNDIDSFYNQGNFNIKNLIAEEDDYNFQILSKHYANKIENFNQIIYLHMAIILCRIVRYRHKNNFPSAVLCYVIATYWFNKYLNS